jgi:hypothetical protein
MPTLHGVQRGKMKHEKKINIARGELSGKKNYRGEKQNSPTLQGYKPIYC